MSPVGEHQSLTPRPPCPTCGMLLEHTLSGGMICVWAKCPARIEPRFMVTPQGAAALATVHAWVNPMVRATDPESETEEQREIRYLRDDVMHRLAQYPHVTDPEKLIRLAGRDGRLLRILEEMNAELSRTVVAWKSETATLHAEMVTLRHQLAEAERARDSALQANAAYESLNSLMAEQYAQADATAATLTGEGDPA